MTHSAPEPGTPWTFSFARAAVPLRTWRLGVCAALCASALSCGGGGSGGAATGLSGSSTPPPTGSNVVSVVVDAGPTSTSPDANTLFTTVTVCVPGSTTSCQTIDHIQVDTMSYGLRILAPVLTISLPVQPATSGTMLAECTAFADGYSWGSVALADVQISGESASSVPVQVIGDPNFTNIPADCQGLGAQEDTVAAFGANGILGIGVFASDCGSGCTTTVDNQIYYACAATAACQPTTVASLASEVTNPVAYFATDNNGVIIQLPTVAASGAATVSGSLIFGIDTQSNNKSGSQTILTVDPSYGDFTTVFDGQTFSESFLDTGSNGIFFNDSNITQCTASGLTDFYCPASTQSFTATLQGQNSVSVSESFSVGDAQTFSGDDAALPLLAGPFSSSPETFDWGLPFYYGRTVYTAIQDDSTAVGTGPYVAF